MARNFLLIGMVLCVVGLQALWVSPECKAKDPVFKITRLQIYFDNHRAEIAVPQNQASFKAYAILEYEGAGLLDGFWEVDGQLFAQVKRHLEGSNGGIITLATPEGVSLPTWRTGSHRLRLVIKTPDLGNKEPEALYYVTASEPPSIVLTSPAPRASLPLVAQTFSWQSGHPVAGYLLSFYDMQDNIVFSVYTKERDYILPDKVVGPLFQAGHHYQWQVTGYDEDLNKKTTSPRQRFVFAR